MRESGHGVRHGESFAHRQRGSEAARRKGPREAVQVRSNNEHLSLLQAWCCLYLEKNEKRKHIQVLMLHTEQLYALSKWVFMTESQSKPRGKSPLRQMNYRQDAENHSCVNPNI